MIRYYTLDKQGNPKQCTMLNWAKCFEEGKSRIVRQEFIGKSKVSTVFLGLDHNFFDKGPPILWETMVFGGKLDQEQDRCSGSRKQAMAMHKRMVNKVKKGQK